AVDREDGQKRPHLVRQPAGGADHRELIEAAVEMPRRIRIERDARRLADADVFDVGLADARPDAHRGGVHHLEDWLPAADFLALLHFAEGAALPDRLEHDEAAERRDDA